MADNTRLEIPEGTILQMAEDGLVLGHNGDVVIRSDLGHRLKRVFSENGSVELAAAGELQVDVVEAKKGRITISGSVQAKSITGAQVALTQGSLSARSVIGETKIELTGGELAVDLLMSPEVHVTSEVKGRATVIESRNELGPHQLKGAFRMAEFMELVPNAQKVIQMEADRLPKLGAGEPEAAPPTAPEPEQPVAEAVPAAEAVAAPPEEAPAEPEAQDAEFEDLVSTEPAPQPEPARDSREAAVGADAAPQAPPDPEADTWGMPEQMPGEASAPEASAAPASPEPPSAPPEPPAPEPSVAPAPPPPAETPPEAPPAPAAEASAPAPAAPPTEERTPPEDSVTQVGGPPETGGGDPPFHGQLIESIDTIQKIYTSWPDGDVPPAVDRLRAMAETGLYSEMKVQLTSLWRQILAYHSKTGTKIPSLQVQQMFRAIQRTLAEHVQ